jgi:hypothetical protein
LGAGGPIFSMPVAVAGGGFSDYLYKRQVFIVVLVVTCK